MQTTNISWADYSWNPSTGCSKIGPECRLCYAETVALNQAERDNPPVGATGDAWTHENADTNVQMHPTRLSDPDDYHFPEGAGRVFVGSMTDMFHREVEPWFVQRVLDRVAEHPEHVWIFLTKRPARAAEWRLTWPENTILGTSVGTGPGGDYPNTTHRIEQLRDVQQSTAFGEPAPRLWVSFEPLIEPVGEVALDHIDWAVVGGESAPKAERREMEHAWARDILRQCREQDVAFYFKQSSGQYAETGTALSVEKQYGEMTVFEQREIREFPALPAVVEQARGER